MATAPMQDDEMMEAPEMEGEEAMEGESNVLFCVEICVNRDGTYSVGLESAEYESAEEQGAEQAGMSKPAAQTFQSVKEAMTAALSIIKNGGEVQDKGYESAEMAKGFKGASL